MSEVKRYKLFRCGFCDCDIDESETGGYVDYDDYKKLEQQKAELINLLCERCDCIGMCEIEEIPCAVHKFKEQ